MVHDTSHTGARSVRQAWAACALSAVALSACVRPPELPALPDAGAVDMAPDMTPADVGDVAPTDMDPTDMDPADMTPAEPDAGVDGGAPPLTCDGGPEPPCNGAPVGTAIPPGWVYIPPDTFTMGIDDPELPVSGPAHLVWLTVPLLMQATEMTQAAWARDVAAAGLGGTQPAYFGPSTDCPGAADSRPVERVSWFDAVTYANLRSTLDGLTPCYDPEALAACAGTFGSGCPDDPMRDETCTGGAALTCDAAALARPEPSCTGYRLPTEAEWSYASRAGTETDYWFGDGRDPADPDAIGLDDAAWWRNNADDCTHPVGTRAPNLWGLYDTLGNVLELTQDGFAAFMPPPEGEQASVDPLLRPASNHVASRGGHFDAPFQGLYRHVRRPAVIAARSRTTGFRLVRPLGAPVGDAPSVSLVDRGEGSDVVTADMPARVTVDVFEPEDEAVEGWLYMLVEPTTDAALLVGAFEQDVDRWSIDVDRATIDGLRPLDPAGERRVFVARFFDATGRSDNIGLTLQFR